MSAASNDLAKLTIIVECITRIGSYIEHYGITRKMYTEPIVEDDILYKDAIDNNVSRMLEEAWGMSDETRERIPEADWHGLAYVRNILTHAYGDVDPDIIWDIIEDELPSLKDGCARCISDIENGDYTPRFTSRAAESASVGEHDGSESVRSQE